MTMYKVWLHHTKSNRSNCGEPTHSVAVCKQN